MRYEFQSELARRSAAEGFKEGFKEGFEEGFEEGFKEGQQMALTRWLCRKFGELPDWAVQRLRAADEADIERWAERLLDAATLDDVFAD